MRAEQDTTRQDRDRWHAHAERLGGTVDRLTITVAELGDRVVEQRALRNGAEEPARGEDAPVPPQQPWWRFWRR